MDIENLIETVLGLNAEVITPTQMVSRAVTVYVLALVMVRVGNKRFLGKNTAFDVILAIVFGSVISRAINGSAPFFPTLLASFVLVMLHWLISSLAFRVASFRGTVKGHERWLMQDGKIDWDVMAQSSITEHDLMKAIRAEMRENTLDNVQEAVLERDGSISILPKPTEPKVIDVIIAEGVQMVRIQLE